MPEVSLPSPRQPHSALMFIAACAVMAAGPLLWHAARAAWGPGDSTLAPSNLPALEVARDRYPFDASPIDGLRATQPGMVIIGDSMALRVDADLAGRRTGRPVVPLIRLATGSAHWYLLLKNYVVASGVQPDWVVIFFRDTLLTDPLWRLAGRDRFSTDRYALDAEPELNAIVAANVQNPWYRLHLGLDRVYDVERTRDWLEPALTGALSHVVSGGRSRDDFTARMNEMFGLDRLRAFAAADMGDAEASSLTFDARVGQSTLPLMLDLARQRGLRLCFVRVLRRPTNGQPPRETAELRRYMVALRRYVESRGARLLDDRDDPALWRLGYDDGDHILDEERPAYTERFFDRIMGQP